MKKGSRKKRLQDLRRLQEQQRHQRLQDQLEQRHQQLQQLFQLNQQTIIDETLFRSVWNNTILRRLICSKIGECIPISNGKRIQLKDTFFAEMEQYNKEPDQFLKYGGNQRFYECGVITADLFKYHYQHTHRSWLQEDQVETRLSVLDLISGNHRNMIDTWLFRSAYNYLKRTDPQSILADQHMTTWHNVISSNNVELYNYVKTVLPMPGLEGIKQIVANATKHTRMRTMGSYHANTYGSISPPPGTKLLKTLLKDLRLIDPKETRWLELCDYGMLAESGCTDIMETIHKYAGDYYCPSEKAIMVRAIQNNQIESIRFLYKVNKIPIGQVMLEAARTCDLSFLVELHNIEPEAGRLYTLFLKVMSPSFAKGPLRFSPSESTQWQTFQQEFYQLGKQLNYIDTNLQHQIDTKQPFRYQPKNIQQHFKIFQQSNVDDSSIPTLSFSSFDD
ncbi:hypothetical protein DFA_00185 [Cavenderia fasciculata]|uniref:Uncharacterized protein n=1 Tax=Cavenderia fasciculata TaxID=261658 RepID=F4PXU7_CACFS|nr:uncharacterized protein DFA_00185 [Cavenderia fasciculata]EGG19607.1 hypothetical protein DFA_00185 [Cavenderia fasciculata]|eukprot:XP_004357901.1 hypothetical protein DFA_00185 [Cavenderia fasciculata]